MKGAVVAAAGGLIRVSEPAGLDTPYIAITSAAFEGIDTTLNHCVGVGES